MDFELPHNFECRAYQNDLFRYMDFDGFNKKRAFLCWHRRSGKDKTCWNYMVKEATRVVGNYFYFFPTYNQGRKALWDGKDRDGFKMLDHIPKGLIKHIRNDEMKVTLVNDSIIQIVGTDNYDSIMGSGPKGVVFSEFSLQDPQAWDYVSPMLIENDGWAVFNCTPRGRNHAYILYDKVKNNENWYVSLLTIHNTIQEDGSPFVSSDMIQAEIDRGMSDALIQQEYFCSWDAMLEDCYFGDTLARHDKTIGGAVGRLRDFKGEIEFIKKPKGGILEVWRFPYNRLNDYDNIPWINRYTIGTDISEGLRQDYSVAYVFDRLLGEFVARMRSNTIDSYSWGEQLLLLSQFYDNALIVPERNGAGISVCKFLHDKQANLYINTIPAKAGQGVTKIIGWQETNLAKHDLCGDLKEYFRVTESNIYDSLLLAECSTFIAMRSDSGNVTRLGADSGFHDDMVIAAGLAIQGHYWLGDKPRKKDIPLTGWQKRVTEKGESAWTV
jgi:hypothetical protein